MLAPTSEMVFPPLAANVPPQAEVVPLGTVRPGGNVSVKETPASGTVFAAGLVMVKVNADVPLITMLAGLKVFAIDGGATTTCGLPVSVPVLPLNLASPAYEVLIV